MKARARYFVWAAAFLLAVLLFAYHARSHCMAECPSAPVGCVRTTLDPGACADSACSTPLPVCHYAAAEDSAGAVCPPTLAGRCIP